MSKIVFILGAGASAQSGVPMMTGFLEKAEDLARAGVLGAHQHDFDTALRARAKLTQTHSKALGIDVHNMEAVFSAFVMARLIGRLGDLKPEEIENLPNLYRQVISQTIDRTMEFPIFKGKIQPPQPYGNFVQSINDAAANISILTFNYDLGIDFALEFHGIELDYCIAPTTATDRLKLIKLHGSLNWSKLTDGSIYPVSPSKLLSGMNLDTEDRFIRIPFSRWVEPYVNRSGRTERYSPYIIAPTWNKANDTPGFSHVWKHAAACLHSAEHIVVIGYSLPDSDQFFKYLYALGTAGDSILRNFWVIDPSPGVGAKFESMLGPTARAKFQYWESTFNDSISLIGELIQGRR